MKEKTCDKNDWGKEEMRRRRRRQEDENLREGKGFTEERWKKRKRSLEMTVQRKIKKYWTGKMEKNFFFFFFTVD